MGIQAKNQFLKLEFTLTQNAQVDCSAVTDNQSDPEPSDIGNWRLRGLLIFLVYLIKPQEMAHPLMYKPII